MRTRILFLAALSPLVALASLTTSAQAASQATGRDLRCFMASSLLATSDDPNMKTTGAIIAAFFAGKVFGAAPDINLPAAMKAEAATLTPAAAKELLMACAGEFKSRAAQISAAGQAIQGGAPKP
jgi:hypothetical protein